MRKIGTLLIAIVFITIAVICIALIVDEARYAYGADVDVDVSRTLEVEDHPTAKLPTKPMEFSSPSSTPAGAPDPGVKELVEINAAKGNQPTTMPGGKPKK